MLTAISIIGAAILIAVMLHKIAIALGQICVAIHRVEIVCRDRQEGKKN